jgi:uncharacterized protein YjbI with pentapeptide repeats
LFSNLRSLARDRTLDRSEQKRFSSAALEALMAGYSEAATKPPTSRAMLARADFTAANLRAVDLSRAMIGTANFAGADLREADFTGTDLSRAGMAQADLRGAIGTAARWPAALDPTEEGVVR